MPLMQVLLTWKKASCFLLSNAVSVMARFTKKKTGFREPSTVPRRVQLVMANSVTSDTVHLAVALPNGPSLRGVVGRPAASFEGFEYSKSILEKLKGVVWSEEKLDRWITNSQAWVPGSFMFYKQPDAETRRKIILYLKENP